MLHSTCYIRMMWRSYRWLFPEVLASYGRVLAVLKKLKTLMLNQATVFRTRGCMRAILEESVGNHRQDSLSLRFPVSQALVSQCHVALLASAVPNHSKASPQGSSAATLSQGNLELALHFHQEEQKRSKPDVEVRWVRTHEPQVQSQSKWHQQFLKSCFQSQNRQCMSLSWVRLSIGLVCSSKCSSTRRRKSKSHLTLALAC